MPSRQRFAATSCRRVAGPVLRLHSSKHALVRRPTISGLLALFLALLALTVGAAARPLLAQFGPDTAEAETGEGMLPGAPATRAAGSADASGRAWWNVWSEASTEDRVLWGMWSTHVNRDNDGWQNDRVLTLIYEGFYAGTFRTTHGPRAYTVGVERSWIEGSAGPLFGMAGFRSGLVYGYDRRLGWVAEKYPVLPFAQPVVYGRLGPLTTDLTYTWVVISLTAGLRF